jgi:hypothetical protein
MKAKACAEWSRIPKRKLELVCGFNIKVREEATT